MSQKSGTSISSERIVKEIRRATRKQYSAEEKIRIVLDGLRGEHSIAELCRPERVWNRIPDRIRDQIVQMALDEPELSPRELATRFTDTKSYFVSEASVY